MNVVPSIEDEERRQTVKINSSVGSRCRRKQHVNKLFSKRHRFSIANAVLFLKKSHECTPWSVWRFQPTSVFTAKKRNML